VVSERRLYRRSADVERAISGSSAGRGALDVERDVQVGSDGEERENHEDENKVRRNHHANKSPALKGASQNSVKDKR
jgi:hypothetical protein